VGQDAIVSYDRFLSGIHAEVQVSMKDQAYYPPPESQGGWRVLKKPDREG